MPTIVRVFCTLNTPTFSVLAIILLTIGATSVSAQEQQEDLTGRWIAVLKGGPTPAIEKAILTKDGGTLYAPLSRIKQFGELKFELKRNEDGNFTFAAGRAKGTLSGKATNGGLSGGITYEGGPALGIPFFLTRDESYVKPTQTPFIFIPGVCGTVLNSEWKKALGSERDSGQVWPLAGPSANRYDLSCRKDGSHAGFRESKITTGEVMQKVAKAVSIYSEFRNHFSKDGWKRGVNYFEFPYDWRLDNEAHLQALDKLVNQARMASEQKQIALVAHSMGGVIARAYVLSSRERASKIKMIVTMGTPYGGAPVVFYGLGAGYNFDNPTAHPAMMKLLCQNFPAAYQLLPYTPFVFEKDAQEPLTLDQTFATKYRAVRYIYPLPAFEYRQSSTPIWQPNPQLLAKAQSFRSKYGPSDDTAGVPTYTIRGYDAQTVVGFRIYSLEDYNKTFGTSSENYVLSHDGRKVVLSPIFGDGDGTVPIERSALPGAKRSFYISNMFGGATHGELPGFLWGRVIVDDLLRGKLPPDSKWQYKPRYQNPHEFLPGTYWWAYSKIFGTPIANQIFFTLRSNAFLSVENSEGQKLGLDETGRVHQEIPGAAFVEICGAEYAALKDLDEDYKIKITGIEDGSFSFFVDVIQEGKPCAEFVYRDVPVKKGTVATVSIRPDGLSGSPPVLEVQSDGKTTQISATLKRECSCDAGQGGSAAGELFAANRLAETGQEVFLPVYLRTSQSLANMNFTVKYDPSVVSMLEDPSRGNLLGGSLFTSNGGEQGLARIAFAQTTGVTGDGTAANLRFRAIGSPGDSTPLTLEISRTDNPQGEAQDVTTRHGSIRILSPGGQLPGDGDGDGRITALDALIALKMSVELLPERAVYDLDEDQDVTSRDAVLILQQALGK